MSSGYHAFTDDEKLNFIKRQLFLFIIQVLSYVGWFINSIYINLNLIMCIFVFFCIDSNQKICNCVVSDHTYIENRNGCLFKR